MVKESVATDHGLKFPGAKVTMMVSWLRWRDAGSWWCREPVLFPILFHEWVGTAPNEYDICAISVKVNHHHRVKLVSSVLLRIAPAPFYIIINLLISRDYNARY